MTIDKVDVDPGVSWCVYVPQIPIRKFRGVECRFCGWYISVVPPPGAHALHHRCARKYPMPFTTVALGNIKRYIRSKWCAGDRCARFGESSACALMKMKTGYHSRKKTIYYD